MWSTIKEAMKQFAPHRDKLFAAAYSLPWPPAIKEKAAAVLPHIYRKGIDKVRLNTPSIGQYWPTHPTFAYDNGRAVFVKAGPVGVIEREYQNLMLLKKYGVSVATPLGVYVTPDNLYEEDALMSPGVIHGALMIEEFLHSISFGHALVERRIPVRSLISMTANAVNWMHRFGVHGDFKHQHIRVCVPSKAAVRMIFTPPRDDILVDINRVCIIDMEGFTFRAPGSVDAEKRRADIEYLKSTLESYFNQLDSESPENIRRLTVMSGEERRRRFSGVWERLEAAINAPRRQDRYIERIDG